MVKIMDLSQLSPSNLESVDFMPIVDVSDTTQSSGGTTKRILRGDVFWKPFSTQKFIGVGGATGTPNGSGVLFPATADPSSDVNMLDDYEEGTWTPTWYGSTTAGTTTYTQQQGSYTKIGNMIFFAFQMTVTNSTGTGNIRIGGFPFNCWNNSTYGAINTYFAGFNLTGYVAGNYVASLAIASNSNFAVPYMSLTGQIAGAEIPIATDRAGILNAFGFYVSEIDAS